MSGFILPVAGTVFAFFVVFEITKRWFARRETRLRCLMEEVCPVCGHDRMMRDTVTSFLFSRKRPSLTCKECGNEFLVPAARTAARIREAMSRKLDERIKTLHMGPRP